jgi:1-acyl-sn-glycerol-3-phosphate acyltransferase
MWTQCLRSWLFDILFYSLTFLYLTFFRPLIWILPRPFTQKLFRVWTQGIVWGLRVFVGITHRVEGLEHYEAAKRLGHPVIIASRHESAWDTVIFALYLGDFAIVLKQELLRVPIWGSYLKRLGCIGIDRKKVGAQGIRHLRDQTQKVVEQGVSILIFPEGTRCEPGESKELQPGVGLLYTQLEACIVPVAHNAGLCWGRRAFYKKPGCITLRFLPPVKPGLSRTEVLEKIAPQLLIKK